MAIPPRNNYHQYTIKRQKNNLRKGGVVLEIQEIIGIASRKTALFLRETRRGSVLMANSAGIYLEMDGQILLLHDRIWGQVPMGIGVKLYANAVKLLSPKVGDGVSCREGYLHFPAGWIKIAETYPPAPKVCARMGSDRRKLGVEALRDREKGLAPLAWQQEKNPLCALAAPRLEALCLGIGAGDTAAIDAAVESLLGLGPGLTPSADDVLCGMLYALQRSPAAEKTAVAALSDAVCRHGDSCTHPVSAAYLKAIANGERFSRLEDAWLGRDDHFEALLEVGSSSGADMLLGLLLADYILGMEEWTDD